MHPPMGRQLTQLQRLTTSQLRRRYAEVFGEPTRANNQTWLIKRIAWRLQELAEGGLSERARRRGVELANDADLRMNPPRPPRAAKTAPVIPATASEPALDKRLPPTGTVLTRRYKGQALQVEVLPRGFAYQGQVFKSLSAVAQAITGSHCNGFWFFGLTAKGGR
jgi:Protein of unknown function (DUF2924)